MYCKVRISSTIYSYSLLSSSTTSRSLFSSFVYLSCSWISLSFYRQNQPLPIATREEGGRPQTIGDVISCDVRLLKRVCSISYTTLQDYLCISYAKQWLGLAFLNICSWKFRLAVRYSCCFVHGPLYMLWYLRFLSCLKVNNASQESISVP